MEGCSDSSHKKQTVLMQRILSFYNLGVILIKWSGTFKFGIADGHIGSNRRIVNRSSEKRDFNLRQRCQKSCMVLHFCGKRKDRCISRMGSENCRSFILCWFFSVFKVYVFIITNNPSRCLIQCVNKAWESCQLVGSFV